MKLRLLAVVIMMMFPIAGLSYTADEQASPGVQAPAPAQSVGAQAGESARELKATADATLSTGAMKVSEATQKVQTEVQDTLKVLQQQWEVLAKQLQEKTRQIQKLLEQQWQEFNQSFHKPQP